MRQATDQEIKKFCQYRANHVALVQRIGQVVFGENLSEHDYDKITADGDKLNLYALRNAMINGEYHPRTEDKAELDSLVGEHVKSQKHHPEFWDPGISARTFDDKNPPQVHAARMPDKYIIEMACDWAAVALKRNQPLFAWYNKVCTGDNPRFIFTSKQKKLLVDSIQKIIDKIDEEKLSYPGIKYTAKQIEPAVEYDELQEFFRRFSK